MPQIVSNLELKLKLYPICAVLEMARLLRRPPTTPPLVPRMRLALNPLGRKLLPGAGTLGRGPKDPTLPTWGARAIPLRRSHQMTQIKQSKRLLYRLMQTAELLPSRRLPRLPCLPLSTPGCAASLVGFATLTDPSESWQIYLLYLFINSDSHFRGLS